MTVPSTIGIRHRLFLLVVAVISCSLGIFCTSDSPEQQKPDTELTVRVAGIIMRWISGDREANLVRFEKLAREAASQGAKIICTPESFLDGYSIRIPNLPENGFRALAEEISSSAYVVRIRQLAQECSTYLAVGITERDDDKVYNSAVLIAPDGSIAGVYRKKYLWTTETDRYTAGTSLPTFNTTYGRIGMMICSDRREPAAMEELKRNGANLVLCLAGGGYGEENDSVVCARAREGGVPVVFVHPLEFLVADSKGRVATQSILGYWLDARPEDGICGEVRYCDIGLPYVEK